MVRPLLAALRPYPPPPPLVASLCVFAGATLASLLFLWRQQQRQKDKESNRNCIYLDYNGTTPVYDFVVKAMMPYFQQHYGNPSSGHFYGKEPRQAVDLARTQILLLLHDNNNNKVGNSDDKKELPPPKESIWFTSCGTESDNLAIHLALQATKHLFVGDSNNKDKKKLHIVTSNVEHPAVEACLRALEEEEQVCTVTYVPVQRDGRVLAEDMIKAMTPNTILVTLMLANNETGALQPVKQVAEHCRQQGVLFHTDAAQAAGKVSLNLKDTLGNPDMVSIVGHKLGAPKGIACLYVRPNCLEEHGRQIRHQHGILLLGGNQEFGRRGGTENVPYIAGMGVAAERAARHLAQNAAHMERLRSRLLTQLQQTLNSGAGAGTDEARPVVVVHGPADAQHRLPNTLSVGIAHVHSGKLLSAVADKVAASAGATCHSTAGISAVLKAMHIPNELARGTLRLSVGPHATMQQMDQAAQIIAEEALGQLAERPKVVRL